MKTKFVALLLIFLSLSAPTISPAQQVAPDAAALAQQGKVALDQKDYAKAVEFYTKAIQLAPAQVDYQIALADAHFKWGEDPKTDSLAAIPHFQAAYEIDKVHRRSEAGFDLYYIGVAYSWLRRNEEALRYLEQALPIHREFKNRDREASTLYYIGAACNRLGRYEEALKYYEQALSIQRGIKYRRGEGDSLNNIGLGHWSLGRYEEALKYYEQALTIQREVKDPQGEANSLHGFGAAYARLSRYEEALRYFEQALLIYREIKDRAGEARSLDWLRYAYEKTHRPNLAIFYGKQSVNALQEIRGNIQGLSQEIQQGYLKSNEGI